MWRSGDHPRAGGEKPLMVNLEAFCQGSPPRRRGKDIRKRRHNVRRGITPAQAGKSRDPADPAALSRDHPRAGGEKISADIIQDFVQGSPPRRRGKVPTIKQRPDVVGITPAQAGKRTASARVFRFTRDHPRVGGEKAQENCRTMALTGSPPRRRGKGRHAEGDEF